MHRNSVSPVVLAAVLSACALEPELLNSERIVQRFGNYGIEVLEQNADVRRSNLYSSDDGIRTCRTYAVVEFGELSGANITDAHQDVLAGGSIGATFRESGWTIRKETVHIGRISFADPDNVAMRLMRLVDVQDLAMHVYRLILERDDKSAHYATIVEVHHPDYLSEDELHGLYGQDMAAKLDPASVKAFVALIQSD
jgi:hypothetical protein